MMIHDLKIQQQFLIHIIEGKKTFEIRKNDRDFQVGDSIHFLPIESDRYNVYKLGKNIKLFYRITYVHSGFGMAEDFVILGIEVE